MEFSPRNDREMAMLIARIGGSSLEQIGQEFGVTRERVRQLLKQMGWENRATAKELGVVYFGGRGNRRHKEDFCAALGNEREVKERHRAERRRQAEKLREIHRTTGRATISDLCYADGLGKNHIHNYLRYWLGRPPRKGTWGVATDRLFRIAGVPRPQKGNIYGRRGRP